MNKKFEPAADYDGLRRQYEALTKLHALTCDELAQSVEREKKALAALSNERASQLQPSTFRTVKEFVIHWGGLPVRALMIIGFALWFCVFGGWWRKKR